MTPKLAPALFALGLLMTGLAGCGEDTPKAGASSTAVDAADEPGQTSGAAESEDAGQEETDEAPATPPVLTDGPGDVTLTIGGGEQELGAGSFGRSEVTVSVGQVVEFQATDGGTYAVKVGGLDGVTVSGGLKEYYRFDAPGTYRVQEELSGATASVVVQP